MTIHILSDDDDDWRGLLESGTTDVRVIPRNTVTLYYIVFREIK